MIEKKRGRKFPTGSTRELFIAQLYLILENHVINLVVSWNRLQYRLSILSEARNDNGRDRDI